MDKVNVCHGDIKLENIIIDQNHQIKLIDFGYAVIWNKKSLSTTYIGTGFYMAPEIYKRIPYNPKKADVFSSGVVLFLLVNGFFPFKDNTDQNGFCKWFCLLNMKPQKYWKKL